MQIRVKLKAECFKVSQLLDKLDMLNHSKL